MYRLTVQYVDREIPAKRNWWHRLTGKGGGPTEIEVRDEPLQGTQTSLTAAYEAAEAKAAELTGLVPDSTAVVIIAVSDGSIVDGVYVNNGGRF